MNLLFLAFAHAVACAAVVFAIVGFATVAYFGLLLCALFGGEDAGGVLALPFLMLGALIAGFGSALLVCVPVSIGTALLCRHVLHWPRVAEIPVAIALCFTEAGLACMAIWWYRDGEAGEGAIVGLWIGLALLLPLCLYWWTVQALVTARAVAVALWRWIRKRAGARSPDRTPPVAHAQPPRSGTQAHRPS